MPTITSLLERNLLSICNERNPKKRIAAIRELWSPTGTFMNTDGTHVGHAAISDAAGLLLGRYPEFDFAIANKADEIPDAGRMAWTFGAPGQSAAAKGLDVIQAEDGRIVKLYTFLDDVAL